MARAVLFVSLVLFAPLLCLPARGQGTGALSGVVEDPTGAPVPDAQVKVLRKEAGIERSATTNEEGRFAFGSLPAGEYVLTVQAQGVKQANTLVKVGATAAAPVRVRLEIADVKEEVTVSASLLASPSAQINADAINIDQDFLRNLPSENAEPLAVPSLFVNPAVTGADGPKIIVDGVETDSLELPVASIKRVYVNKNPYSAEFGRPGKGRIEVKTKRASHHHYHGSAGTVLRNSGFDATNAFAHDRPLQQRAVSEAELNGPVNRRVAFLIAARYDFNNNSSVVNAQTPQGPLVENFVARARNTHLFGRFDIKVSPNSKAIVLYKFKNKSEPGQNVGGLNLPDAATAVFGHENEVKLLETTALSPNFLNELRAGWKQRRQGTDSATSAPAILVLGAMTTGGAQAAHRQRESQGDVEDIVSQVKGRHTFRWGGGMRLRFLRDFDASNFGGTFTFSTLADFSTNQPSLFTINAGQPEVAFTQHEFYAFSQDEMKLRPNLSLMLGLRYEGQSNGNSFRDFAPRFALAYSPRGGETVIRAGFGVFYDRQPADVKQLSLLHDGERIAEFDITNPSYPVPFGPGTQLADVIPSVIRTAPDIGFPRLTQGSLAVERKLGKGENYLTVEYATLGAVRLYRTRNVNAPLPGTTVPPNPNFINIDRFESSGKLHSNGLTVTWRNRAQKRLDLLLQYTLSRTTDDSSGLYSLPADNYNLRPELGRSDFDQRHRLNLAGTYRLPKDFKFGGILKLASGPPFNIITGLDDNNDTAFNDRPPGVARNTGSGPRYADVDARLSRVFRFAKSEGRRQIEVAVDAFNLLNSVNFNNYVGDLTSPFFGRADAAYPARQLQLSMRFSF